MDQQNSTRFCQACGAENPGHATFCTGCGVSLAGSGVPSSPMAQPTYSAPPQMPLSAPPNVPPPYIPSYVEHGARFNAPQETGAMGALKASWELCATNRVMFWLLWLVYVAVASVAGMVPIVGMPLSLAIAGPLALGLWAAVLDAYDGNQLDIGKIFGGFNRFVPGLLTYLASLVPFLIGGALGALIMMPKMIGLSGVLMQWMQTPNQPFPPQLLSIIPFALLAMIPMFIAGIFSIGLQLAYGLLIDNPEMETGQAISRAWELTKANVGSFLVIGLLSGLISIACMVVIFIGWIFLFFVMAPVLQFWVIMYYRSLVSK